MVNFYVYAYLRTDNTPYYIGKGKGDRLYEKSKGHIPPKDKSKIVILENNLTELGAFALERFYIRWYGRKDLNTGILINKTDGGDGICGFKHSEETKNKIAKSNTGRKLSDNTKLKLSIRFKGIKRTDLERIKISQGQLGRKLSEEHKKKLSDIKKGTKHSEETKNKLSEMNKGKKITSEQLEKLRQSAKNRKPSTYNQKTCPHCRLTGVSYNMTRYHFDNCKNIGRIKESVPGNTLGKSHKTKMPREW